MPFTVKIQRIEAYGLSGLRRTTTTNYDQVSNVISTVNAVGANHHHELRCRQQHAVDSQSSWR
jgi:hypothetical protein